MNSLKHQFRLDIYGFRHRDAVLEIERESFAQPWSPDRLAGETAPAGRSCTVALYHGEPYGYVLFDATRQFPSLAIVRLAVHPVIRRSGMGRFLVEFCQRRCRELERADVSVVVPERAVEMQLLLKACGMQCVREVRDQDEATGEDLYRFRWMESAAVAGKEVAA